MALKENIRVEGKRDIQTKVMTTLFALFAEVERDLISERTREGLAEARASGRKLGRPKGSLGVSRLVSTVAGKGVILDRTATTTCRGCMSGHRRQEPVWTSVRGADVKAVSPAERGRSEATRLDVGEHTRTLLA